MSKTSGPAVGEWISKSNDFPSIFNVAFLVCSAMYFTENLSSEFGGVRYSVHEVNKSEEPVWLVYPWENVGNV